ncbi:MAG: SinI family restriction endonuclease [Alphaproteobacteria bacterium]|nr:SinI family restriction endonuclease [Alphaproteobacteria bacterium]
MSLNGKSADLARQVMNQLDPSLSKQFGTLVEFLADNPAAAPQDSRTAALGSDEYLRRQAEKFIKSRAPRAPNPPATIPDEMVSFIINKYFDVPENELERAVELHNLSMGAENLIGDILERYIASIVERHDWVWCSGSIVKAVDFIHRKPDGTWAALQVKNRDNSENSSSSAIRKGTTIDKWFRTFSKKQGDNWSNFPKIVDARLSETDFRRFVEAYLSSLRNR